ncbi:hypothetical protein OB919_07285 [Halobacteria archaeon AArc-curdl1]|uniref:Uncharacterized protein n=1 Tax=Natronosalvus hydrolyticus TaxID=2979988 RepID=A0AAP2Z833_9EURY|nr:hypothetical protein [Halobacteria archaeon AArc-curdl1]
MDISPEEYGAYWQSSLRIAAGVLVIGFGDWFGSFFFEQSALGAVGLGLVIYVGLIVVGCFLITLGGARAVRTAVGAEKRR